MTEIYKQEFGFKLNDLNIAIEWEKVEYAN